MDGPFSVFFSLPGLTGSKITPLVGIGTDRPLHGILIDAGLPVDIEIAFKRGPDVSSRPEEIGTQHPRKRVVRVAEVMRTTHRNAYGSLLPGHAAVMMQRI